MHYISAVSYGTLLPKHVALHMFILTDTVKCLTHILNVGIISKFSSTA